MDVRPACLCGQELGQSSGATWTSREVCMRQGAWGGGAVLLAPNPAAKAEAFCGLGDSSSPLGKPKAVPVQGSPKSNYLPCPSVLINTWLFVNYLLAFQIDATFVRDREPTQHFL
jgi:hypothetical protein